MIRVLVVDDSAVVRRAFATLLQPHGFEVVTAGDAVLAWPKLTGGAFDVLVLDLELPRVHGGELLRRVMQERPMPVVVCSGHVGEGSAQAIRALADGAAELIPKPALDARAFLEGQTLQLVDLLRALAASGRKKRGPGEASPPVYAPERQVGRVVAVGASTGGPEALETVLRRIPRGAPPILIAQHMPDSFTRAFAERLATVTRLDVREARGGEALARGLVLVAPGGRHLTVSPDGTRAVVTLGPRVNFHRPSVDVLFESLIPLGRRALAVLMTGMGEDGALGLARLKGAGALTVAQDETSCVVFGMPGAAIRRGAAEQVLSPTQVADLIGQS